MTYKRFKELMNIKFPKVSDTADLISVSFWIGFWIGITIAFGLALVLNTLLFWIFRSI